MNKIKWSRVKCELWTPIHSIERHSLLLPTDNDTCTVHTRICHQNVRKHMENKTHQWWSLDSHRRNNYYYIIIRVIIIIVVCYYCKAFCATTLMACTWHVYVYIKYNGTEHRIIGVAWHKLHDAEDDTNAVKNRLFFFYFAQEEARRSRDVKFNDKIKF